MAVCHHGAVLWLWHSGLSQRAAAGGSLLKIGPTMPHVTSIRYYVHTRALRFFLCAVVTIRATKQRLFIYGMTNHSVLLTVVS